MGIYGLATDSVSPNCGGRFESNSTSGRGVLGQASATSGNTVGGYFESSSTNGLGVFASASAATGPAYGLSARSNSTSGRAVYGWATAGTGTTYGGYFLSLSPSGNGVFGEATATSGMTYGVYGRNRSSNGTGVAGFTLSSTGSTVGVLGSSSSPEGYGVIGMAISDSGSGIGVRGYTNNSSGKGVHGRTGHPSGPAIGVHGESSSPAGTGVKGTASAASGTTYGVYGDSISATGYAGYFVGSGADALYVENDAYGRGVHVVATADTGLWASTTSGLAGVDGRNASTTGRGVYGYATATSGTNYGVYGRTASSSGYGVYASGNLGASGTKSFCIDHPRDPENKYLLHYSAESPEVINFYRGTVTLEESGEAVVELPDYFSKINKMPSYQLTAIGAPMPMLHVAEEISEKALMAGEQTGPDMAAPLCTFRIAGGVPGAKVSWEVKAVRNDLWVRSRAVPAHTLQGGRLIETRAMPVEVAKQGAEKGKYQHPEHYGRPPQKGVDHHEGREVLPTPGSDGRGY